MKKVYKSIEEIDPRIPRDCWITDKKSKAKIHFILRLTRIGEPVFWANQAFDVDGNECDPTDPEVRKWWQERLPDDIFDGEYVVKAGRLPEEYSA